MALILTSSAALALMYAWTFGKIIAWRREASADDSLRARLADYTHYR